MFRGKAAKLNRAIFQVLTEEKPMAIWDIFKCVTKFKGLKRKRYAVIDVRVKALEAEGYLEVAGERETKQGSKTQLFKLADRGELALVIGPRTIDDIMKELNKETAPMMLKTIRKLPNSPR